MRAGCVSCAWMKGEAPGSLLCQLGVSFLPAGLWIPPSRCRSHTFIWLQPRCCKVLCPVCWCSPSLTPLGRWGAQETRERAGSLHDSLPHPFQLCKLQGKDLTTLRLSFPYENGGNRGDDNVAVVELDGTMCRIRQTLKLYKCQRFAMIFIPHITGLDQNVIFYLEFPGLFFFFVPCYFCQTIVPCIILLLLPTQITVNSVR